MKELLKNPHITEILAEFSYKDEEYRLEYLKFAPAVHIGDFLIFAALSIIRKSDEAVVFSEKYPNYVSSANIKKATKNISTHPNRFIK